MAAGGHALIRELGWPESFADGVSLSLEELQRAVSHTGGMHRLRCVLHKMRMGENVTVGVLGGSAHSMPLLRARVCRCCLEAQPILVAADVRARLQHASNRRPNQTY